MNKIKNFLLLASFGVLILASGCFKSNNQIIEDSLREVYNEDFIVYEIKGAPYGFEATVSPASKPGCLFVAKIKKDGTFIYDDYYKRYVDYRIKEKLQADLEQFFPDACIRVDSNTVRIDDTIDFRNSSLEQLIDNMHDEAGYNKEAMVRLFLGKEAGTNKEYEEEYNYFNDIEKIDNHELIPITICMYFFDEDIKNDIEQYLQHDLDLDNYFVEQVAKSNNRDFWELGVSSNDSTYVGHPPRMSACFIKSMPLYIDSLDEYIRRRELFENAR